MSRKPTFSQRLQYLTDNVMSRGSGVMIAFLFIMSVIIILIVSVVVWLTRWDIQPDGTRLGFTQVVWMGLLRTLDAGTMGGDRGSWPFLISMLAVTLGGVFVVSSLIGIISSGLEQKLEQLKKGRSLVIEDRHTLILGWSPQIFTILLELMTANENQKRARIVVLADKDKVEMDDEIRERVKKKGRTSIICRNGNPIDLNDLEISSPESAHAIIVLPPTDDDPDSYVIKTVLAITDTRTLRDEPSHIVTQIRNPRNLEVTKIVGKNNKVQAVLTGDLIARIVAQTSRQSGLSVVYSELMDFGGD